MKPSTQSSTSSALCVSHFHQLSCSCPLVSADGAVLVTLGGAGLDTVSSIEGAVSSNPEADAAMLERESSDGDMVAKDDEDESDTEGWAATGSSGVSFAGVSVSLWCPTGVRGRRMVPLLGAGMRPIESQIIL